MAALTLILFLSSVLSAEEAKTPPAPKDVPAERQGAEQTKQDPKLAEELGKLGDYLHTSSQNGEAGLTPDGAAKITEFLKSQQGGTSPEMSKLLQELSQDGSQLKDATVLDLKEAAREAVKNGLDLGVKPEMEKWLLDPKTDPAPGQQSAAPNVN